MRQREHPAIDQVGVGVRSHRSGVDGGRLAPGREDGDEAEPVHPVRRERRLPGLQPAHVPPPARRGAALEADGEDVQVPALDAEAVALPVEPDGVRRTHGGEAHGRRG